MIPGISQIRKLPRLGRIRLGAKTKNAQGVEYPTALDHFSFVDVPEVKAIYGDACKELDIMFPLEDQDAFFHQGLAAFRKSGLFCACDDGQTATRVRIGNEDNGQPKDQQGEAALKEMGIEPDSIPVGTRFEMPCPFEDCPLYAAKECCGIGRLMFILPKVKRFGCYEIDTKSVNGISAINSYLDAIRAGAGRVSWIPLKLKLVPKKAMIPGKKQGKDVVFSKVVFHLTIEFAGSPADLVATARHAALPAPPGAVPGPKDLAQHVPEDLYPNGGANLDNRLGDKSRGGPPPIAVSAAAIRSRLGTAPAPQPPAPQPQPESDDGPEGMTMEQMKVLQGQAKPETAAQEPEGPAKGEELF